MKTVRGALSTVGRPGLNSPGRTLGPRGATHAANGM